MLAATSLVVWAALSACASPQARPAPARAGFKVLAVETFLADMAQNVAGERLRIDALLPIGVDPHSFEPTPQDLRRVADCDVLIVNGAGLEEFLTRLLQSAGGKHLVIEAAAGLTSRAGREGEVAEVALADHEHGDPHFWLDPINVVRYVENIRAGLSQADPQGAAAYAAGAAAYAARLQELDQWANAQFAALPEARRQIVTNHESLGYLADRYGLRIVGTIIPSVSTSASPSAEQMAQLVGRIRQAGVQAIFLETGSNPQLARQIAQESGIRVVTDLYTHSVSAPDGPAPTYIDMIRYDTRAMVDALK